MARRKRGKESLLQEVASALLRMSHRVPLIGTVAALACLAGWWFLRARPERLFGAASVFATVLFVLGILFALLAGIGLARNLVPDEGHPPRGRRRS